MSVISKTELSENFISVNVKHLYANLSSEEKSAIMYDDTERIKKTRFSVRNVLLASICLYLFSAFLCVACLIVCLLQFIFCGVFPNLLISDIIVAFFADLIIGIIAGIIIECLDVDDYIK